MHQMLESFRRNDEGAARASAEMMMEQHPRGHGTGGIPGAPQQPRRTFRRADASAPSRRNRGQRRMPSSRETTERGRQLRRSQEFTRRRTTPSLGFDDLDMRGQEQPWAGPGQSGVDGSGRVAQPSHFNQHHQPAPFRIPHPNVNPLTHANFHAIMSEAKDSMDAIDQNRPGCDEAMRETARVLAQIEQECAAGRGDCDAPSAEDLRRRARGRSLREYNDRERGESLGGAAGSGGVGKTSLSNGATFNVGNGGAVHNVEIHHAHAKSVTQKFMTRDTDKAMREMQASGRMLRNGEVSNDRRSVWRMPPGTFVTRAPEDYDQRGHREDVDLRRRQQDEFNIAGSGRGYPQARHAFDEPMPPSHEGGLNHGGRLAMDIEQARSSGLLYPRATPAPFFGDGGVSCENFGGAPPIQNSFSQLPTFGNMSYVNPNAEAQARAADGQRDSSGRGQRQRVGTSQESRARYPNQNKATGEGAASFPALQAAMSTSRSARGEGKGNVPCGLSIIDWACQGSACEGTAAAKPGGAGECPIAKAKMQKLFEQDASYITHFNQAEQNSTKQVLLKKAGGAMQSTQSSLRKLRGEGDPSAPGAMERVTHEESAFDKSHRLHLAKLVKHVEELPWSGSSNGKRDKDKCIDRMEHLADTEQLLLILRLALQQQREGETAEALNKLEALELLLEQGEHINLWACVAMKIKDHLASIYASSSQIDSAVEQYERQHLRKGATDGPIARVQLTQWRPIADLITGELKRISAPLKSTKSSSSTSSSSTSSSSATRTNTATPAKAASTKGTNANE